MEEAGHDEKAEKDSRQKDELPPKRQKRCCIFNCTEKDPDLNSPKDWDSWTRIVRAAEIRGNDTILRIASATEDGVVPEIFYHRTCRNRFTKKRDLDAVEKNQDTGEFSSQVEPEKSRYFHRRSSSVTSTSSRVYKPFCIFCSKDSKYIKGTNTRDPLIQIIDLRADNTVREAALRKNDQRMIALSSRDLVAAEGHYHGQCYREYTRPPKKRKSSDDNNLASTSTTAAESDSDPDTWYAITEKLCYDELFSYIRNVLFQEPKVVKLTELTKKLTDCLSNMGVTEVKASTKKHIQRKLNAEFGESIHMIPDDKGKILVYPDNLLMSELVKENMRLREELKVLKDNTSLKEGMIKNASSLLRNDVRALDIKMPWPPLPAELNDPLAFVPNSLTAFLKVLFSGNSENRVVSERVQRLTESIGQDIVYGITCAKVKPPKHIILPQTVKTLCGNVELIRILNRYGHGMSYTQMEELDTALALKKLETQGADSALIPEDIHPNVMATLAWDNIDRLEETLSGGDTSHRVNGIVVQPKSYGPHYLPKDEPGGVQISGKKERTLGNVQPLLPVYVAGERVGPPVRSYIELTDVEMKREAYRKTLLWMLVRLHCATNQIVSSWTGFNITVRDKEDVTADVVRYLPTINAPAVQLSTVQEILIQSQKIRRSLSLQSIVVVFDQALYAKAVEIIWKHSRTFSDVVPRLGVFHTVCTLLSVIGKRFQDAGLKDLCIESGVIAEGSVNGVLDGHKYNRAVRCHKLLYEALLRLAWKGFLVKDSNTDDSGDIADLIEEFSSNICQDTFTETLENPLYISVADRFDQYLEYLRHGAGDLAAFWMSYIDLVNIMLNMLRGSREGNWSLHLQAIRDMIPWCFAYDRQNYARYLSHYYAEMTHLKTDRPEIHAFLENGGFSVQLGPNNPFGRIPVDQTLEETVNKDTQTPGGTKGFSLKPGAISRYYLTAEYRSSFLHLLREAVGTDSSSSLRHPDLTKSRIAKDEQNVRSLMEMMESNWINPFSTENQDLLNISTGIAAPENITKDLLQAKDIGEQAYKAFREERLEADPPEKKFHDPLKKRNLKTFTDMKVKKTYQAAGRQIILKADRDLFAKMILVAQTRELELKEVLKHRLGPIPWALATPEGTLRKTVKSSLAKNLKKDLAPVESIPENSACIIDGMALVQKVDANHMTFADVSNTLLRMVLRESASCKRIDVVFDVYREHSIKEAERVNRGSASGTTFKAIAPGHKIKQWRKFLCSPENKNKLIQFLANDWSTSGQREKLSNKNMYVTVGELCKKLSVDSAIDVDCLKCGQEEADTRLLFHAANCASAGFSAVMIASEDTDVFVLSVAFTSQIPCPIYIKSGTKTRIQYTDVQKVANMLGKDKCQALLGLHALTGCDTVSAFAGKGKLAALKLLRKNELHLETLKCLGSNWDLSEDLICSLEDFTCKIYSSRTSVKKVNDLRFNIFCARKGEVESWQLPPCSSSLLNHCKRANYQCAIWKRSLQAFPQIPSPVGYGWSLENGELHIDWSTAAPAPEIVMELLSCTCSRQCSAETCTCIQNKLKCTYLCKLTTCLNQKDEEEEEFENRDDMDDNEDDDYDEDDGPSDV